MTTTGSRSRSIRCAPAPRSRISHATAARIYLAAALPIYYPAEPLFAPDLLAVLDVEDAERDKQVVSAEGQGL